MDTFRFAEIADSNFHIAWKDDDRVFYRGRHKGSDGSLVAVLAVRPSSEHPYAATIDRLTHEYGWKDELDSRWALRPLELLQEGGRTVLVLEDSGGEPLSPSGTPMEVKSFLHLAIGVAVAVGELHQRGLVHKDIKPQNLIVEPTRSEVRLTGFGIASRLRRERQGMQPPETIAGTLAYMAPEQTGWMNRSIDSRSDLYRGEAMKNHISVRTKLAESLPLVQADRTQLQQVLLNVVINAIHALTESGTAPRELLVSTSTDEANEVLVSVRDSGKGISAEQLERLFDPFYTTKSDGMGMGLSIKFHRRGPWRKDLGGS